MALAEERGRGGEGGEEGGEGESRKGRGRGRGGRRGERHKLEFLQSEVFENEGESNKAYEWSTLAGCPFLILVSGAILT